MARPKKEIGEEKPKKGVTYSEVKADKGILVDKDRYLLFLDIYHHLRPYLERENKTTKEELIKLFPQDKQLTEDVWTCVFELGLIWPQDMTGRLFSQTE